jgi:hypothetical protein
MKVEWYKCQGGIWCELNKVDTEHSILSNVTGVYVIWSGTKERVIIKVGYGKISDELEINKSDFAVQAFASKGLYVSWAEVPLLKRKGVSSYLILTLNPKFVDIEVKSSEVPVNLPWDSN